MLRLVADRVIERLAGWAERHENIRALILTSTRAVPGSHVDAYSDYDVIAVVRRVEPMVEDTAWLAEFGEVLVAYWDPVHINESGIADLVAQRT